MAGNESIVQTAQGYSENVDRPRDAGRDAAACAIAGVDPYDAKLLLVFATAHFGGQDAMEEVLAGAMEGVRKHRTKPIPVAGCTAVALIAKGELRERGVLAVAIASSGMHVTVGVGRGAYDDPRGAVEEALRGADLVGAAKRGASGLLLGFLPGFRNCEQPHAATPADYRDDVITAEVVGQMPRYYTFFAGSAADNLRRHQSYQFANDQVTDDGVVLAMVECNNAYRVGRASAFRCTNDRFLVAGQGKDDARIVTHLQPVDAQRKPLPAQDCLREYVATCPGSDLDPEWDVAFAVPTGLTNEYNVQRHVFISDPKGAVAFFRPISKDVVLSAIERDGKIVEDAAREAVRRALSPAKWQPEDGSPPALYVISCAGKRANTWDSSRKEVQALADASGNPALLFGWYAFGEFASRRFKGVGCSHYSLNVLALKGDPYFRFTNRQKALEVCRHLTTAVPQLEAARSQDVLCQHAVDRLAPVFSGGLISLYDKQKKSLIGKYSCGKEWGRVRDETRRRVPSKDILPIVYKREPLQAEVIRDSSTHEACDSAAVSKGHVKGQIVVCIHDGEERWGTLQAGIPQGVEDEDIYYRQEVVAALETYGTVVGTALRRLRETTKAAQFGAQLHKQAVQVKTDRDFRALVDEALQWLVRNTRSFCGTIRLLSQKDKVFRFRAAFSPQREFEREFLGTEWNAEAKPGADDDSVCAEVYRTGRLYHTDSSQEESVCRSPFPDMSSHIAVPLKTGEEVWGVVGLNKRHPGKYTELEIQMVERFASRLSDAIRIARGELARTTYRESTRLLLLPANGSIKENENFPGRMEQVLRLLEAATGASECVLYVIKPEQPHLARCIATLGEEGGPEPKRTVRLARKRSRGSEWEEMVRAAITGPGQRAGRRWSNNGTDYIAYRLDAPLGQLDRVGALIVGKRRTCPLKALMASHVDLLESLADLIALGIAHSLFTQQVERREALKTQRIQVQAHQFRGPISGAAAALEQVLAREDLPSWISDKLTIQHDRLEKFKQIVNAVLLLEQVELDDAGGWRQPVAFGDVVKESVRSLRDSRDIADRTVRVFSGPSVVVAGHTELIAIALDNLLSNAVRHTSVDGEIVIEVNALRPRDKLDECVYVPKPGEGVRSVNTVQGCFPAPVRGRFSEDWDAVVSLSVRDNGEGMSPEQRANVFHRGYTRPAESGEKGTGFGLSIVRQVMDAHDGQVAVRSEPGRGSEFILLFPVEQTDTGGD